MKKSNLFILSFFLLTLIGIVMIFSASMIWAEFNYNDKFFYLKRQLIFFLLSIVSFIFFSKLNYLKLRKHANLLFIISIILLIIVLIPGIGILKNGARSWIGIGDLSFQPSEITKIALIIFTSKYCGNNPGSFRKIKNILLFSIVLLLVFFLIMLEPDFGSGFILMVTIFIMMYKELIPYKLLFISFGVVLAGGVILIMIAPYRIDRINSYLDPWNDPLGGGFQIIQSLFAISPAGFFGYGLFNSKQKFYYLPEPQTDFIFAICIEELGLLGGLIILSLFFYIIYIGYKLSKFKEDTFAMNLTFGFTTLLFIQVFINIGVVIGLLPVTGVTLPFISYGGSSLIINFTIMGILTNIIKSKENNISFDNYK